MNPKSLLNFLSQYYERIIAVVVMLFFAVFSVLLLWRVNDLKNKIKEDFRKPGAMVKPVNLKDLEESEQRLQKPPSWMDEGHKLFVGPEMKELQAGKITLWTGKGGNTSEGLSYEWLHQFDLPTDRAIGATDPDGDGFTVLEEYAAKTDPTDPKSKPDVAGKLRIELPILQKAFPFKFNGVSSGLGDSSGSSEQKLMIQRCDVQNGTTYFMKINEVVKDPKFPNYKVVKHDAIFTNIVNKSIIGSDGKPLVTRMDISEVTLQKEGEGSIVLVKGTPRTSDEFYAKLFYIIEGRHLPEMPKGSKFELDGKQYEITDIVNSKNPDEIRVNLKHSDTNVEFIVKPLTSDEKALYQKKDPAAQSAPEEVN